MGNKDVRSPGEETLEGQGLSIQRMPRNQTRTERSSLHREKVFKMKENWCELYVGKKDALWKNRKFPERNRDK